MIVGSAVHNTDLCWPSLRVIVYDMWLRSIRLLPSLSFSTRWRTSSSCHQQAIFTCAKLLGCQSLEYLVTRLLNEITDQATATWGIAMDADELRLVWTDTLGTAMAIDGRLSVEQTLNINRPSWCREQDHGPNVDQPFSLISHNHTFYVWSVAVDNQLIRRTNRKKRSVLIGLLFNQSQFAYYSTVIVLLFLSFFDVDNPDSNSKCLPGSISLFLRQHVQYVSIMHRLQVILVASGPKLVASGPRLSLPHGASVQVCTWLCAWLAATCALLTLPHPVCSICAPVQICTWLCAWLAATCALLIPSHPVCSICASVQICTWLCAWLAATCALLIPSHPVCSICASVQVCTWLCACSHLCTTYRL